jgi:predicted acetyltransferase
MATWDSIRPVTEDELAQVSLIHEHAFHGGPMSERDRAGLLTRLDLGRTLAVFDGTQPVGIAAAFSFRMRVPGALIPVAGVSLVAVLPTCRRRGVLTALMRRQLDDLSLGGEPVAALYSSEAGIYGRFGYGCASWHAYFTVHGGEGRLAPGAPSDPRLRLRLAEPAAARAELAKVYDLELAERPGLFARSGAWWDRVISDEETRRGGASPLRCVIAEDDAGPRGYALLHARARWDEPAFLPDCQVEVRELMAADPAAAALLWSDLLSRDLATGFHAGMRPADDVLPYLLADQRRVRSQISDGLWVRLVDAGRALALRRYACPVEVVIEISDGLCPGNQGRWRLATGGGHHADGLPATCERTTSRPDLSLGVQALGAAYLGGTRLGPLARAGQVTEHTPGAVAALSAAMSWDPAPWCPVIF